MIMVTMRSRPAVSLPRTFAATALLFLVSATAFGGRPDPPPAKDATTYPAFDIHQKEQVAIAAEPYETKEKCKVFQVDYMQYRFLPIRIIVTNMGDRPISLNDARIFFVDAAGERIQAAEPEDVERRIRPRYNKATDIPIGPIHLPHKATTSEPKIEADFNEFEYAALAVEPHTTRAGFLFYDVDGLGDTPLRGAKLVLRELKNADGQQLFYFEIPFDKYLNAAH